jgi:hypothetical protein
VSSVNTVIADCESNSVGFGRLKCRISDRLRNGLASRFADDRLVELSTKIMDGRSLRR